VDQLSTRIMLANRQLGLRPKFYTIGAPQPELFHRSSTDVYITEGLVARCATDGQLASLLCLELAKMVAERETVTAEQVRFPERAAPMEVAPGNDYAGAFGPAEQLHRAEVGKYEEERRERASAAQTPPDPQALARDILVKAGFAESDFDAAAGLQKQAEGGSLAQQLTSQPAAQAKK
jgi:hypothetical protein